MNKLLIVALISVVLVASPAVEAQNRGNVRSAPCPFSCKTQGISKAQCKDWRHGDICFVEDLRGGGATTGTGGRVSSSRCPHSCATLGIPKAQCRDWRQGDICYVEDLRGAGGRGPARMPRPGRM